MNVDRERQLAEIAAYAAANFHTCGGHGELAARINAFWASWTAEVTPAPGQECGTSLLPDNVVVTKGKTLKKKDRKIMNKLMKKGYSPEQAINALNNTYRQYSYAGGNILQKSSRPSALTAQEQAWVNTVATHRMDGKDQQADLAVFKAIYKAATGRPPSSGRIVSSTFDLLTAR